MTDGYEIFRDLIRCLETQGLVEPAGRLRSLLQTAWTSSSELLGELGLELRRIEHDHKLSFSPETQQSFAACTKAVKRIWR